MTAKKVKTDNEKIVKVETVIGFEDIFVFLEELGHDAIHYLDWINLRWMQRVAHGKEVGGRDSSGLEVGDLGLNVAGGDIDAFLT